MNKLEVGKTYLLAAINGEYPRHSVEVISQNSVGNFNCKVRYSSDDASAVNDCTFRPNGVSVYFGEDCRVDWDKVNAEAEPVGCVAHTTCDEQPPVVFPGPCVAHAFCDEQMQERVVGFREALDTVPGLIAELATPVIGTKADGGKPKPRLLHESMAGAVASVVDVLTFGAAKYDDDNWKNVEPKRYTDALYRHLNAHHKGEANDAESGLPHLAHAACCVLFLLHHEVNK